jgi:hypothetical protein
MSPAFIVKAAQRARGPVRTHTDYWQLRRDHRAIGSGKSLFLRMVAGLDPNEGEVRAE